MPRSAVQSQSSSQGPASRWPTLSLRSKIILLIFLVFCLYFLMDSVVRSHVVYSSFLKIERKQAEAQAASYVQELRREALLISLMARDLAQSDEMQLLLDAQYAGPFEHYLTMQNAVRLNVAMLCRPDGRSIWRRVIDPRTREVTDLPEFPDGNVPRHHVLLRPSAEAGSIEGMLLSDRGLLIVSSHAVSLRTEDETAAVLIVGRLLTEEGIQNLVKQTSGSVKIWPLIPESLPLAEREALGELGRNQSTVIRESGKELLQVYTRLSDLSGRPAVLLRADVPRDISISGAVVVRVAQIAMAVSAILILGVLWLSLQRVVVDRVRVISDFARTVGDHDDLSVRLNMIGRDEISVLAREMDRMVQSLAESRVRMLDTAHRAGMAEIATEVLHNVGNALNSVSVSSEMLDEHLARLRVEGLQKATDLIRENRSDLATFFVVDPRGGMMLDYLAALTSSFRGEHGQMKSEVQLIREKISHIRDIIALQQAYASSAQFARDEDISEIMEDALRVHLPLIESHAIAVQREYQPLDPVTISRNKLLQVLVNLIKNGCEAMAEAGERPHRLVLRIRRVEAESICIEVEDNGVGFETQQSVKVFEFGFTTKESGHGFGLHFCANTIAEMGGTIAARSAGPDTGATFSITLPTQPRSATGTGSNANELRTQ